MNSGSKEASFGSSSLRAAWSAAICSPSGRRAVAVLQIPGAGGEHQPPDGGVEVELDLAVDLVVQCIDLAIERRQRKTVAHHREGAHHLARAVPCRVHEPCHERRSAAVDEVVGDDARDDLAAQPVRGDVGREFLLHTIREISEKIALEMRIVGHVAGDDVGEEHDLAVGKQHTEFGPCQRLAARLALGECGRRRQGLDRAVEQAARLERRHEAHLMREVGHAGLLHDGKRQRLLVVVGKHELRHLVGHVGEQPVARRPRQRAPAHRRSQRDLDVDLDVRAVDAARIVDGVGIAGAAEHAELDAGTLGDAEIGALADHLRPDVGGGDADRVVGTVADILVGLGGGAHIGADAAEPEQVDRRLEDGLHDLDRRRDGLCQADRRGSGGGERDRFLAARDDGAARGQLRLVVVLPARTRQREHALALGHG